MNGQSTWRLRSRLAKAVLITLVAIGIGGCRRTVETKQPVVVGVVLPMTGILAEMGQYERQAMDLASAKLVADGANIQLRYEDGKGDNKVVASATQKLLDVDHARLLITSTTGASMTARPIAQRKNIPLLAFCMGSDVAADSPTTVRYYIGIEEESAAIMKHLATLPRASRVGVLYASVAVWDKAVKELYEPFLRKQFSAPAVIEQYNLKDRDFRPVLARFKDAGTNVLVILGYGFEYEPLFTQLEALKMRDSTSIVGGWGFLYTPLPATVLEGIHVAGPRYVFDRGSAGSEFARAFEQKHGRRPNFDAAFAYEVVRRLPELLAMIDQPERGPLKLQLSKRGQMDGVFGKYHFTERGNLVVETGVGVFHNGEIVGTP